MTKPQAMNQILTVRVHSISNWDDTENEYCRKWFGSNWIEGGYVLCAYCLEAAVPFHGYIGSHVCEACQDSVGRLESRAL